jgi:hypothetical protein
MLRKACGRSLRLKQVPAELWLSEGVCQIMRTPSKREVRRIRHLSAWIVEAGHEDRECQVMDVSKNGAKIITAMPSQVPGRFELMFTQGDTKRRLCDVIWRRGKIIGVQFVNA